MKLPVGQSSPTWTDADSGAQKLFRRNTAIADQRVELFHNLLQNLTIARLLQGDLRPLQNVPFQVGQAQVERVSLHDNPKGKAAVLVDVQQRAPASPAGGPSFGGELAPLGEDALLKELADQKSHRALWQRELPDHIHSGAGAPCPQVIEDFQPARSFCFVPD